LFCNQLVGAPGVRRYLCRIADTLNYFNGEIRNYQSRIANYG
jgi:hypothetical protein